MTTSWITQLSMEPVLIGIGVDNKAVTHRLISDGGSFTVNFWNADDTRVFVKFSKPAAYEQADDGRHDAGQRKPDRHVEPEPDDAQDRVQGELADPGGQLGPLEQVSGRQHEGGGQQGRAHALGMATTAPLGNPVARVTPRSGRRAP